MSCVLWYLGKPIIRMYQMNMLLESNIENIDYYSILIIFTLKFTVASISNKDSNESLMTYSYSPFRIIFCGQFVFVLWVSRDEDDFFSYISIASKFKVHRCLSFSSKICKIIIKNLKNHHGLWKFPFWLTLFLIIAFYQNCLQV